MRRTIFIVFLLVSLLTLQSVHVMAQKGKIRIGNMKIIPGVTVEGVHDDNIYLGSGTNNTTELEENDWINHIMPSLCLTYTFPERGSLKLGYKGDLAYYSTNENNDWNTHKGLLSLNYNAPGGLILGLDITYTSAEDPYSTGNQYKLGVPRTDRWSNDLKTQIGYDFGNKLKLLGYFNRYKQDYELVQDYSQDYHAYEFGAGVQIRILPKTWGFARYHFGERDYFTQPAGMGVTETNDSDFDWHRINMGLSWDSAAKLNGELNFGYHWKGYDNLTDAGGDRYDDKNTWIAATSLSFKATPVTTLALSITRSIRESGSDTNEYFDDTGVGLNLRQMLLPKITLTVGGSYISNGYNLPLNRPREDDNYKVDIGLGYRIQEWLSAGIGYSYNTKDSNYNENDYTDNQFTISLKGGY